MSYEQPKTEREKEFYEVVSKILKFVEHADKSYQAEKSVTNEQWAKQTQRS